MPKHAPSTQPAKPSLARQRGTPGQPEPVPREAGVRRRRLLDAALNTFLRYGFRKTSMEEVARAAKLSRVLLERTWTRLSRPGPRKTTILNSTAR